MTDPNDALRSILAADRPSAQRIALLHSLREELRGEQAVLALLAAAVSEPALDLRRAFFEHVAGVDISRVADRAALLDGLLHVAAREDDASLRRLALDRLGAWYGSEPRAAEVLLATVESELNAGLQVLAFAGWGRTVSPPPAQVERLVQFAPHAPIALREPLIERLVRCDADTAQRGLAVFLDSGERPEVRAHALDALAALPRLDAATLARVRACLEGPGEAPLHARALAILRDATPGDRDCLDALCGHLLRFPDRADALEALRHRLASFPDLAPRLAEAFQGVRSSRLRAALLDVLRPAPLLPLFTWALHDASWQVRRAALRCCAHHRTAHAALLDRAILIAARQESVVCLREEMAACFTDGRRRETDVDRDLLAWIERETEPRVERVLARALVTIPPSRDHACILPRVYFKVLSDPAADAELRRDILAQLGNVAFRHVPEVAGCLRALLQRAATIEEAEPLYERLRELEPDAAAHADLLLTLFLRFAGAYPREPLQQWLREFERLAPTHAAIRAQIPFLVRMTGASWLSGAAEVEARKGMFLPALLEQIQRDHGLEAGRLLRESWEARTIRRSDMLLLFRRLLHRPREESLMQAALVMMAKGGMTGPEILDLGFDYLAEFPRHGSYTHLIAEFLQGRNQDHAPMRSIDEVRVDLEPGRRKDPHYRRRVFEAFTQRGLNRYFHRLPEELKARPPIRDWSPWEYELWPDKGIEWKIAEMFLALKPFDRIAALLAAPVDPGVSPARTIQYLLLLHLWKIAHEPLPPAVTDELLRGVGALFRHASERKGMALLHDRATLIFHSLWTRQINSQEGGRAVSPELAELAADVYARLCRVSAGFACDDDKRFPAVFPPLLQGLDAKRLQAIWPFDPGAWIRLFHEHFEGAEEEAGARALYDRAVALQADALCEEAFPCYDRLLTSMAGTRFVKRMRSTIAYGKDDCDPGVPVGEHESAAAESQHGILREQVEHGKIAAALHTLDRLLKRFWRTPFLRERREELVKLRAELKGKCPPAVDPDA